MLSSTLNAIKASMNRGNIFKMVERFGTQKRTDGGRFISKTEVRKMRVSELRMELQSRGLPTDGLRADLVQKLLDALFVNTETNVDGTSNGSGGFSIEPNDMHVLRFQGDNNHLAASASFGAILYNAETSKTVWKGRLYLRNGESRQEAEYVGLKQSILSAQNLGVNQLILQGSNTSTVVKHLTSKNKVKAKSLKYLNEKVRAIIDTLEHCEIWGIDANENKKAASLARRAMKTRSSEGFEVSTIKGRIDLDVDQENENELPNLYAEEESTENLPQSLAQGNLEPNFTLPVLSPAKVYVLRFDGGSRSNPGIAGCGMVIFDSESGLEVWSAYKFLNHATNNEAEYTSLCEGMKFAKLMGIKHLVAEGDSQLVIKQINGEYQVKKEQLKPLYQKASSTSKCFWSFQLRHIPREENFRADQLANIAMDSNTSSHEILARMT